MGKKSNPQRRLFLDGNQWCATGIGFRNLALDEAGFGDTQEEAIVQLNEPGPRGVEAFEVGGFCRQCTEWVEEEVQMDGCRDPDCPCQ
ncbi:MAG: hypothetical protein V3V96_15580 [Acidiferrobacterales bacterium]